METDFQTLFGYAAGLLGFVAYAWYSRAILQGTTKPNRMTWIIVALVSWVLLLTSKAGGADDTTWLILGEALASSVVVLVSFFRHADERTPKEILRDRICLAGAVVSFILWQVFDSSLLGLLGGILVDTFALWPTVVKSFDEPGEEDKTAWTMTQVANVFNLFATNFTVFAIWVFPVWRFALDGAIIYALYRRRNK